MLKMFHMLKMVHMLKIFQHVENGPTWSNMLKMVEDGPTCCFGNKVHVYIMVVLVCRLVACEPREE